MDQHAELPVQSHEEMWIEIVRKMEELYAELAHTIQELEAKSHAVQNARRFTERILGSMPSALLVVATDGSIRMVNNACLELLGYDADALVGQPIARLIAPSSEDFSPGARLWQNIINGHAANGVELSLLARDQSTVPVSFSASALRDEYDEVAEIVAIAVDLRQMKRLLEAERHKANALEQANRTMRELQARLVHGEKMSSLGRMAAGVVHEINTPLNGITIYSNLILEETTDQDHRRENLLKVVQETERCKRIVRGMLEFARLSPGEVQCVDVNQLLRTTLASLQDQPVFKNVSVALALNPVPALCGERDQLQQAFSNVLLNAAQAMRQGGRLEVTSGLSAAETQIRITVADTGCGIPPDNLSRIFEPFFTTRQHQGGTGLGLAITHSIVERHGGSLQVRSKVGEGTAVTLAFPVPPERKQP